MANDREAAWQRFEADGCGGCDVIGAGPCSACFNAGYDAARPEWVRIRSVEDLPTEGKWWITWFGGFNNRLWVNKGEPIGAGVFAAEGLIIAPPKIRAVMPAHPRPDPFIPPFKEESE